MKKIYTLAFLFTFIFINAQVVYTGKPRYKIDVKRGGTFLGSVTIELFPNIAYHHTRNFDSLVSVHFYDSTAFHRVIPGFMIQGGDPNSRHDTSSSWGFGQAGQPTVNAEFSVAKHLRGIISAARSNNINSATSQFFICVAAAPSLNNQYSIYGRVTSGMNYVDTIVNAPRNSNDLPNVKHEMFITAIGSNDTIPLAPVLNSPADSSFAVPTNVSLLQKWNTVKDGIIYTLEVSDDENFTNIIKTLETSGNSAYLATNLMNPDTKYYWRVKTNNGGHFSPWSKVWMFDTSIDAVGISSNTLSTDKVKIFPNPSQGKFSFSNLEKGTKVEIYDVSGKRVYEITAKDNSLTIDLEGKEKGIYSYKIISEKSATLQGKLILK